MALAQLIYRERLQNIVTGLKSMQSKLYHMGIWGKVSRSNLADSNDQHPWQLYVDYAHVLIREAQALYAIDSFEIELDHIVYALDASTIDLGISLFPYARFGSSIEPSNFIPS